MNQAQEQQQQVITAALRRYQALQRDECMDPFVLESRPTKKQFEVLRGINHYPIRAVIAGNQTGKSLLGGRETAWLFQENHPFFTRPAEWQQEPLMILVIGQVGEQLESNLWNRKIKPFLDPGCYKEVRIGNSLQRVINTKNGNTIIFISHHDANAARKTAQGYVAHYVWLDEMPNSLSLVAELQTRIIAKNARLLITFTPLLQNVDIKNFIEGLKDPIGKKYRFNMLDNPIYKGREDQIIQQYATLPEAERNARLFGEWFSGALSVYDFNPDMHVAPIPQEYRASWNHVEAVDPAASGKTGYILLAQSPVQRTWYVVNSKYVDGAAATDLLDRIEILSAGYNTIRKVSDPHEVWFIKEASKRGRIYSGVYNKTQRKHELIKGLQEALTSGKLKIGSDNAELIQELVGCQWSETSEDKIVGASKYHLLDALQYALDNLPKDSTPVVAIHPDPVVQNDIEIRAKNQERKKAERKKIQKILQGKRSRWKRS
jgi:hypothetical protein